MIQSWSKLNLLLLIIGIMSVGLGCGVNSRTPQEVAQDEIITQRVLVKLEGLPLRPPPQDYLNASTERGVVRLRGVVGDWYIRDKAVELAKSVEGVKEVTQNIRIEPGRGGTPMGGGGGGP